MQCQAGRIYSVLLFNIKAEWLSERKNNKIKILDYMIAISFMITHGSIDSAGL
jgi:hypothetical protein